MVAPGLGTGRRAIARVLDFIHGHTDTHTHTATARPTRTNKEANHVDVALVCRTGLRCSGRSVDEIASRLASLPPSVQEAAAAAFDGDGTSAGAALPSPVAAHSSAPWEQAAGTISDLLHEVELASLYLDTFEEYDYSRVGQLTQLGREGCDAALQELGITRDHRDRITNLAFSKRPLGTCGSCFSDHFLSAIRPAFASTMGCENMGILLYALCRFLKPQGVLEVGAGVTSLWLLQALRDNHEELGCRAAAQKEDWKGYRVGSLPGAEWMVEEELEPRAATVPILHCVDRISHGHTTAHKVATAADELGLSAHLKFHEVDGYEPRRPLPNRRAATLLSTSSGSTLELASAGDSTNF